MMQPLPFTLYQAAQIGQLEQTALQECGLSGFALMQTAALALWNLIHTRWTNAKKISVFCGAGNNAGDGYMLATLALKAGVVVEVYAVVNPNNLKNEALKAYQTYQQAGGDVVSFSGSVAIQTDLIVDALLGTGLNRQVDGVYAQAIESINAAVCPVLAVDLPSGLHADTGNQMGCAVKASVTLSFIGLKQGLFTADGRELCGEIIYASLNIPDTLFSTIIPHAYRLAAELKLPIRARNTHKGHYGHCLVIGGEHGYSGAPRLAAEAALYTGAGLVSIATRAYHAAGLNQGRFELMVHPIETVTDLAPLLSKANVIVLGVGLGQKTWGQALFHTAIKQSQPLIVDADALNLLAKQPTQRENWILTPHPAEAARLLNCSTAQISADRFAAVTAIQARYGGVCILKGAGTLIFDGKKLSVCDAGNSGMAAAGMGDVLAGVLGGLVAQGFSLPRAATVGTLNHSRAADLAVSKNGERGLLAGDLMPYLRSLVN